MNNFGLREHFKLLALSTFMLKFECLNGMKDIVCRSSMQLEVRVFGFYANLVSSFFHVKRNHLLKYLSRNSKFYLQLLIQAVR